MNNRPRRSRAPAALLLLAPAALLLFSSARAEQQAQQKWLVDRALSVTPAAAPVPALRYRLFPLSSERKDGNAVPMYLRFAHERSDARKRQLREKPEAWNKLPLEKLPLAEVKEFLKGYQYNFQQLDLGARRKTADWAYSFDAGNPIGMLLPDAQEMRMQAPLLVLKARVEMAEGRFADAVRTLETGFSFARQVSEAPLLINALIGAAIAGQMADCLAELIERPDAPNLYWALAVLPRPLIDLRPAYDIEHKLLQMQFPDLADLDRRRSAEEWDAALKHIRSELARFGKGDPNFKPKPGCGPDDPAAKSPDLPAARKYLTEVGGLPASRVAAMPPAEVLLRHVGAYYHELRDEVFKTTYLPFKQARPLFDAAEQRLKAGPDTEAWQVARLFLPAVLKVRLAQVRLQRRLALLQAVEALRMHAAAHDGALPETLAGVTPVPVPDDPGTCKPFEYQREGRSAATLSSRLPGEPLQTHGLRYRLTVRK